MADRKVVRKGAPNSVYIGRPSFLGNPFVIGEDGNRAEVIEKYRIWFTNRIASNPTFGDAVRAYCGDKDLACWCAPLSCHGDVIKEFLDG